MKMRGAEAILLETSFEGKKALRKIREKKEYRNAELDFKLRKGRTRREAKLLKKAREAGIPCPEVFREAEFELIFSFIPGTLASEMKLNPGHLEEFAKMLASLHAVNIIHGDFTPANLIIDKNEVSVIDFGLGYFSHKTEDKAVDVFTMKQALGKEKGEAFAEYYSKYGDRLILNRMDEVEKRARYQER